jgi:hypothetical protein
LIIKLEGNFIESLSHQQHYHINDGKKNVNKTLTVKSNQDENDVADGWQWDTKEVNVLGKKLD